MSFIELEKNKTLNKYKIEVSYSLERDKVIRAIIDLDPYAIIKIKNEWSFKVKTKFTYSELFLHMMKENTNLNFLSKFKKAWWF